MTRPPHRWPARSTATLIREAIAELEAQEPKRRKWYRFSWDEDAFEARLDRYREALDMLREALERLEEA